MDPQITRRGLLRGGTVVGTLASASALLPTPPAGAREQSDLEVLQRLIRVEQVVTFAYGYVLSARIVGATTPMVTVFSDHERQHVALLSAGVARLGGTAPAPPPSVARAEEALTALHVTKRLSQLRTERDAVELLLGAEAASIGAYYVAISKLADPALLQSAAETMAAEAQHATALRRVLHPRSVDQFVPSAFEAGRR